MLRQVAEDVLVHESVWCQSNAVIVEGKDDLLLVDAGIHQSELLDIAKDVAELGRTVVMGFSTHPHWDHMLWHPALGTPPRFGTATAAASARQRLSGDIHAIAKAVGIPEEVPLELLGEIAGLREDATSIPWDGPRIRILEHAAHAAGHAALLIEVSRVLIAGDMLSDRFIPMLDLMAAADPIGDYLAALHLFESVAAEVDVVIPGHGTVGDADAFLARIAADRAYVEALRDGTPVSDPRIDAPAPGWEWVSDVHEGQLTRLAARGA